MNNHRYIVNEYESIFLESQEPFNSLFSCDEIMLQFVAHGNNYVLATDDVGEIISVFKVLLSKALENNSQLDKSINEDLGFLWNQRLHRFADQNFKPSKSRSDWVGSKYRLWSTLDNIEKPTDTWLYNDHAGNIILEITPAYKWHFGDLGSEPEDDPNFITYDEFIKNYQPYITRVIPREVAQQWLKQVSEFWDAIKENERLAALE